MIKKMIIKLLPYDKALHLLGGVLLSLLLLNLFNWWITLIIVAIIAVGIEIYDKVSKKGTSEVLDAVYTLIGYVIVILLK